MAGWKSSERSYLALMLDDHAIMLGDSSGVLYYHDSGPNQKKSSALAACQITKESRVPNVHQIADKGVETTRLL